MLGFKFLGNTRVPHKKHTAELPAFRMSPPPEVLVPTAQHIGAPATPVVKPGEEVRVGQVIAEAAGVVSAPVHAPVSGKVMKIEKYLRPDGSTVPAIRIASDGLMTPCDGITPSTVNDLDGLIEACRNAGLVGLGGAGFPTAVKLAAAKNGGIDTVIINAAECEPYLTSDTRAMLDWHELVKEGVELLLTHIPTLTGVIIAIEDNKKACIDKMSEVFADNSRVSVFTLPSKYPQGAEKVIVYNTTKRVIPEGKLPADVGALVINVSTVAVLANYVKTGMPLVERCVTVDGDALVSPANVTVPLGTSIGAVIEAVGGLKEEPGKVLYGGPMMGICAASLDEPITKTTGGITVLTRKSSLKHDATACIHCGRCVTACPLNLNPTAYSRALNIESIEEKVERLEGYKIALCIECGCCSFVCPANRPLVQNNRLAKAAVKEYRSHMAGKK